MGHSVKTTLSIPREGANLTKPYYLTRLLSTPFLLISYDTLNAACYGQRLLFLAGSLTEQTWSEVKFPKMLLLPFSTPSTLAHAYTLFVSTSVLSTPPLE